MGLNLYSIEEKLAVVEIEIARTRLFRREHGSAAQRHYEILKAVASDLQSRLDLPRSNTLGSIEREMATVIKSKTALGYERRQLVHLANMVIGRWPTISQALEQFGEESAE